MIKTLFQTKRRALLIVLLLFIVSLLIHSYYKHSKKPKENPISVTVASLQQKDVTIEAHAVGVVQPYVSVSIRPQVDGQLLKVGFSEGEVVKENQVIFQIDPSQYQVALQQAKANLARDVAQLTNYQKTLARFAPLVKKGFVSKQDFDQADANVKAQEAMVLAEKSAVAAAQLNLDYCTVRAPISGRTGNVLINQGNLARAADQNPLVVINKITPIYVSFSLPEQQLGYIQKELKDGRVPVQLKSKHTNALLAGELSFVDNTVDASTGMIKLKAVFANTQEELWPGEYVDVILPVTKMQHAMILPTRAIQEGPEGSYVFVVDKESHVSIKSIKSGYSVNNETVINGLTVPSTVVVTGQTQLVEGSLVRAVDERSIA